MPDFRAPPPPSLLPPPDGVPVVTRTVNRVPAMIAYWDAAQRCVFANSAYQEWFGRRPEEMSGITMAQLLGPLYEMNLPFIRGALAGEEQVFERQIRLPNGEVRETIATYTPDVVDGTVRGFSAHVADVTPLRRRENHLRQVIHEVIHILEQTKRSFHSKELAVLRTRLEQLDRILDQETAGGPKPAV